MLLWKESSCSHFFLDICVFDFSEDVEEYNYAHVEEGEDEDSLGGELESCGVFGVKRELVLSALGSCSWLGLSSGCLS